MKPFRYAAIFLLLFCFTSSLPAEQKKLSLPAEGTFSVVVIPDTQHYYGGKKEGQQETPVTNPHFADHVKWISENLEKQNIVFVSHVGDIVDKNQHDQWEVAKACMDQIHGKVPYGISVGNHDMKASGDSSLFQEYFPKSHFEQFPWYGGCFQAKQETPQISGNNANSFQRIETNGVKLLFIHLECNAPDDVLDWANQVLTQHADHQAIITSHMGLGVQNKPSTNEGHIKDEKGRMLWKKIHGGRGNTPQQMWEKCYQKHKNLFLVLSGDQSRTQALRTANPGQQGNLIHEVVQDYKMEKKIGWLRLYRFTPQENRIEVITFNPQDETLCPGTKLLPGPESHQFELKHKFSEN